MRQITKGPPPQELLAWSAANNRSVNHNYAEMPGTVKEAVKHGLLSEQGWLCGYTGIALTEPGSHIEHFKPQRLCARGIEDVDYRNLLAAYPGRDRAGDSALGFGAPFKASEFDEANLISPWSEECERRFKFALNGDISPANGQDTPARYTITTLGLEHKRLVGLRAAVIGVLTQRTLSVPELRRIITGLDRTDGNGRLREFCFVLKQVAASLIDKAEKLRRRREFAKRQSNS